MNDLAEEIHVVHVQGHKLADPHAGTVEHLHDGPVPCAEPCVGGRCVEQPLDIFVFEKLGQLFFLLGCLDRSYGVGIQMTPLDKEFVEAAQCCEFAGDRGF